ncbi:family 78 glycoside hydrolase catalytic domain [Paenibacillus gansuensis]|uniref:alpha-L-rhamnosidase n=1 Tax=Paenibacillus gansuensis TaxID=306542 RepID=A0ABW5P7R9_9BACL
MVTVRKVRIEYKRNPLGIDVQKPRISWQLQSDRRGTAQQAYQIQVSVEDTFQLVLWNTQKVDSEDNLHIPYEGPELVARTRYFVRVRIWDEQGQVSPWSEIGHWETALLAAGDWEAQWITPAEDHLNRQEEAAFLLRKEFEVRPQIRSARIYSTALGVYELHLNGTRVSEDRLSPGWTSYSHRLQYQTYDVTGLLNDGANAVGMALANGWYKGNLAWDGRSNIYGDRRAGLLQLEIRYEDGSRQVISTDETWSSATGPVVYAEIYHGETYDARLEISGWSEAGSPSGSWGTVETLAPPAAVLKAQESEPVQVVSEIKPVELIHTPSGETVIDFGQNMVGWVAFRVTGEAGTTVTLHHAEVLDGEGNFYTENLRSAKQQIRYICKGGQEERYEPHFTFQGFRYVKVEGYTGELRLDAFTGRVVHSAMEQTGKFECSNPLLNQLQSNIVWGQKGNFLDVPTDCPQRDERLGWTGDAQVFIRTAAFNMEVASFFTKWLRDLQADQAEDGAVPFVVPNVLDGYSSAAWGDAAVICPWNLYVCYGDRRILQEQFASMKAWVEYIRRQGDNEYLWNTGFHFGDWLGLDAKENSYIGATPTDLIATAFYAYSTQLVSKAAEVLGLEEEARKYKELHSRISEHFHLEFVTPNHRLAAPTQTAHVLALMFGLVEGPAKERTAATLAKMIEDNKYHLTTGFVGTPYLCLALSENGYHETAAKLVTQTSYPSWLYSITKGATTIWEHWDGIKEDGSFWSKDMNSYNHYAYGSIGDWLYRVLAGLDAAEDRPGYKRILLKPQPSEEFEYASAELESMYGPIRSSWRRDSESLTMAVEIEIPANTTAQVTLPEAAADRVMEGGTLLSQTEGINSVRQLGSAVVFEAGSGKYSFSYPLAARLAEQTV